MAGLGYKKMHGAVPQLWGQAYSDSVITRNNNNQVNVNFNFSMKIGEYRGGYWDYLWYLNLNVNDQQHSQKMLMKPSTHYHQKLYGKEYYMSTKHGNYKRTITVGPTDTSIRLTATFSDTNKNVGYYVYDVPIPAATPPNALSVTVSSISSSSATISGSTNYAGDYSHITGWKIEYGINNINENNQAKSNGNASETFILNNLKPDAEYKYRITVTNSSGLSRSHNGTFRTDQDNVGYIQNSIRKTYKFPAGSIIEINNWNDLIESSPAAYIKFKNPSANYFNIKQLTVGMDISGWEIFADSLYFFVNEIKTGNLLACSNGITVSSAAYVSKETGSIKLGNCKITIGDHILAYDRQQKIVGWVVRDSGKQKINKINKVNPA